MQAVFILRRAVGVDEHSRKGKRCGRPKSSAAAVDSRKRSERRLQPAKTERIAVSFAGESAVSRPQEGGDPFLLLTCFFPQFS